MHAKRGKTAQGVLDFRHHLQGLVVCGEEEFEAAGGGAELDEVFEEGLVVLIREGEVDGVENEPGGFVGQALEEGLEGGAAQGVEYAVVEGAVAFYGEAIALEDLGEASLSDDSVGDVLGAEEGFGGGESPQDEAGV